jgi:hypothetical protein
LGTANRHNLATTIASSLAGASHFVLVLSEPALRSDWVKRELSSDFFSSDDAGLESLLAMFARARAAVGGQLPGRRYSSAVRGVPGGLAMPTHLSSIVVGGSEWSFAAVFEVVGDYSLRGELANHSHRTHDRAPEVSDLRSGKPLRIYANRQRSGHRVQE